MLRPLHASFHVVWFTSLFLSWRYLLRHAVLCFNLAHGGIFFASWLLFAHRDGVLFSSLAVLVLCCLPLRQLVAAYFFAHGSCLLLCLIVRTYTSDVERFVSRSAACLSADSDRSVVLHPCNEVRSFYRLL